MNPGNHALLTSPKRIGNSSELIASTKTITFLVICGMMMLGGFYFFVHCRFSLFFSWLPVFRASWGPRFTNVQAGMPKVLEKLMSSSTLMQHLPGHWSNLTRVKIGDLARCGWAAWCVQDGGLLNDQVLGL